MCDSISILVPCLCLAASQPAIAQNRSPARPQGLFHRHLADYDAELRLPNGRVDTDAMVARLKELGVTTYYWLICHAETDWDDLQVFLPKAAKAGIEVWVYLVPPTESPPRPGQKYAEPFRLDYARWAVEIAKLSLRHPNLTAWVIDDFYANHEFFTPAYIRDFQKKSKAINPRLAFLPLMYFNELRPQFVADYREVIDGVVVAYLQDREEIDWTWTLLNDVPLPSRSVHLRFRGTCRRWPAITRWRARPQRCCPANGSGSSSSSAMTIWGRPPVFTSSNFWSTGPLFGKRTLPAERMAGTTSRWTSRHRRKAKPTSGWRSACWTSGASATSAYIGRCATCVRRICTWPPTWAGRKSGRSASAAPLKRASAPPRRPHGGAFTSLSYR